MKIGQAVAFTWGFAEPGSEALQNTIVRVGQVVGIIHNGNQVGIVPDDKSEDGVMVKVSTSGQMLFSPKGEVHKVRDPEVAKLAYKLLGIEWGEHAKKLEVVPFGDDVEEDEDDDEEDEDFDCSLCGFDCSLCGFDIEHCIC